MMRWLLGFLLVWGSGCIFITDDQRQEKDNSLECANSPAPEDPITDMIVVQPGTFTMGSPASEEDRFPDEDQHEVTLTRSFYLGATEVTQAQFDGVMDDNPSEHDDCENSPVEEVNWHEAAAFTNALSDAASLTRCYSCSGSGSSVTCTAPRDPYDCEGYRLPTEAEWEYAARAGQSTLYSGSDDIDDVAWYINNTNDTSHPAGGKEANAWGFHDMSGNVAEWCNDRGGLYFGDETDPVGDPDDSSRVYRGGSWSNIAGSVRVANRSDIDPGNRDDDLGFRLARSGP